MFDTLNKRQSLIVGLIAVLMMLFAAACTPAGNEPPAAATGSGQDPTTTSPTTALPTVEVPATETTLPQTTATPSPELPTATTESTGETSDELVGSRWNLLTLAGESPITGSQITLDFDNEGQLGGSSGCNSFFGHYTIEGEALTISEVGSTMMACMDNGVMEQESAYLGALAAAESYTLSDDQLTIQTAQGELVFQTPTDQLLENVTWVLSGIVKGDAVVSTAIDSEITATFAAGTVAGSAGCNLYSAPYTMDGNTLTVGVMTSTEKACEQERNERETTYLAALQGIASYQIERDALTLFDASGNAVLMYTAQ